MILVPAMRSNTVVLSKSYTCPSSMKCTDSTDFEFVLLQSFLCFISQILPYAFHLPYVHLTVVGILRLSVSLVVQGPFCLCWKGLLDVKSKYLHWVTLVAKKWLSDCCCVPKTSRNFIFPSPFYT